MTDLNQTALERAGLMDDRRHERIHKHNSLTTQTIKKDYLGFQFYVFGLALLGMTEGGGVGDRRVGTPTSAAN